ncbi:autotransporter-associated beta strand repeat-containing protein [Luteolibacter arcticus]|uniref:Autotransporter-associated beta strand repeat-containing protein n=1 Tax=Luteolibacter arcticus TaxID=1581411 RepID=A0ABT3GIC4_9BACT|nr:autotransporter-associated beta strand repeat-containing protein [Luteolibacter arcticus]MCW1923255.1 autotransporter-associated beta strand repeat-containing protein [Luteolibacter arcticus]
MKKYSLSSYLLPSSVMVFTCAAIHTARAADDLWSVTGPATWTVGTNWSLGNPPTTLDRAIISNGGSATLASGDAITIDKFRLVNGSLAMTGGTLATTTLTDTDSLKIGDYAYNLAGGTVALTMSGASAITAADRIYVADGEGTGVTTVVTNVTATLSDTASLTATNDYVILGRVNGTANVTLNNSAVIEKKGATNTFIIGDGVRGTGNVTLNDSSSLKSANQFVIGNAGTGNVTLKSTSSVLASGGTVTIGNAANSIGTVALQDSSTFTLSTGTCILGNANTAQGTLTLTGSSAFNVLANEMYVGNASGGTGTLTISDNATLTKGATGFAFTIGRSNGTGTVTVQNSGKLVSQNSLRMTEGATANATLNVKDSGIVQVTGSMQIGYSGTGLLDVTSNTATVTVGGELSVASNVGKGTLRMTGGTLNATGAGTYVIGGGNGAQATVTLSGTSALNGGNMKWKAGDYGGAAGATGSTNVTLSDTASLTLREFTLGHIGGAPATATVNLLGTSTLTVNNYVTLGRDDAGTNGGMSATLNLNGGTLATKSVRSGGSASALLNTINGDGGAIKALATEPDFFQPTANNAARPRVVLGNSGLSFNTNGFTVGIKNALTGTGGLTKTGAGKLVFFSSQPFTGTTAVNQGTLELDTASSLAGPLYAASGGTVSISGSSGSSALVPDLTLAGGSQLVLPAQSTAPITASTVLATLGPVTVTISGTLAVGDYPLIDHFGAGAIQGVGASAFQLAPLGRGVVASIVDEDGMVKLRVTAVNPLQWTGVNVNSLWDINTTSNWTLSGVSNTYQENDNALFNDTATRTDVILNSTVNPSNVRFSNNSKDYTLSGTGAIAGATAGLTKEGSRKLTVTTANTYGGTTAVNGGTLQFGDGTSNGSIAGPLAVNGGNVVFNPTGSSTYAGSISGFGFDATSGLSKTGGGTQIFTGLANTFDGPFAISGGTVKFGDGVVNGALGTTTVYDLAAGTTLAIDFATAINFSASGISPWSKVTGPGLVTLNSAQAVNGSANWGDLAFTPDFTGTLSVLKGRVQTPTPDSMGGTSALVLADGSQILVLNSGTPYTTPLQMAGYGWGEGGFNAGALRVAANAGATWGGNITLTANAGIFAQVNGQLTVTGTISGPYVLQLHSQAQAAEAFPGTLTLAPSVQNSYASTLINGNAGGMVKAGSQYAFSTGPLEVNSSNMWLNGYSFTFASLTGTGGKIGNYGTTPSVLTVGNSTSTTYAGVLLDGGTGTLSLVKNGTGTLTLTGANTYTGNTTVHAGVLSVSTAFLGDASAVTIDSGAVLNLGTGTEDTVGTLFLGGTQVPAGTYGPTTPVYGTYFTGSTGTLVVTTGPGNAFGTWATLKGLDGSPGRENGTGDDPEKDGMDNLTEFYLDGNPLASDRSILPVASLSQDYLTLTFHRRDDAEGILSEQLVQYGQDLTTWAEATITAGDSTDPNGVIVDVEENDAGADLVTVKIPRAIGKFFARLKVEVP